MAVQLNILGKQGLIIATLCLVEVISFLVCGVWEMIYLSNKNNSETASVTEYGDYTYINSYNDDENNYSESQTQRYTELGCIIICVVGIFVSALMIFGILKKHKNLIAPWIIVYGLCSVAGVCYFIYSLITVVTTRNIFKVMEVFNLGCLALYPVVMLFKQMHREASEKKKLQRQIESEAADDSICPKFNPHFEETVVKEV